MMSLRPAAPTLPTATRPQLRPGRWCRTLRAWRTWSVAAGTSLVLGCQAQAPRPGADAADSPLARLQAAIGDPRCSGDSQCRTVAVGEKACGGPEAWLAWSTASASAPAVQAAAEATTRAAKLRNQQGGLMSTCQYLPDPGARCVAGHCAVSQPPAVRLGN